MLVVIAALVGCARYEYDVIQPAEFAGHVGTRSDYVFQRDPRGRLHVAPRSDARGCCDDVS